MGGKKDLEQALVWDLPPARILEGFLCIGWCVVKACLGLQS